MAKTFRALCDQADWVKKPRAKIEPAKKTEEHKQLMEKSEEKENTNGGVSDRLRLAPTGLHYNIQIHLPATRDNAVYDAIFKSLREHLLK